MSTVTRERGAPAPPPPPPRPPQRPGHARRAPNAGPWVRGLAVLALLAAIAVIVYLVTRSSSTTYRLDFTNAGQLVNGDLVRIGGVPAGKITKIALTGDGMAQVSISLDSQYAPLRRGTTATIRNPGIADVANRYLDVSPAPTFRPALHGGATIPATQTNGIVDVDEVFNALDGPTRQGLRGVIRGFSTWYSGKSAQANASARLFPAALQSYTKLFGQIDADTPALDRFVGQTESALARLNADPGALTDLVSQARTTVDALGSDNASLSAGLQNLPAALNHGTATFRRLRTQSLPALQRLTDATGPVITPLEQLLPRLNPVLAEAQPTFTLLRQVLDRPGPDNDLYDALTRLPTLGRQVDGDLPRAVTALHKGTPIFQYARPYFPDLVAWIANWDGIFAPYDGNGHYARTSPIFDAFRLSGQTLTQTPPGGRGTGLRTGLMARCPGSAAAVGDGSGPFVDSGAQANPHCDRSEAAAP